jgi:hypothetical protein
MPGAGGQIAFVVWVGSSHSHDQKIFSKMSYPCFVLLSHPHTVEPALLSVTCTFVGDLHFCR